MDAPTERCFFLLHLILTGLGAQTTELYDFICWTHLETKNLKTSSKSNLYEDGVASLKNDKDVFEKV